ncbi:unnamed protein product [Callosobruchus maculatus]|uniref:Uncharacterized protein n=1 Tax=Callosobruchus maculatus TaxID=64391 RepID=A0A653CZN3_CALMS|nr:unnamed protein product [Callosobruchus maculatus]
MRLLLRCAHSSCWRALKTRRSRRTTKPATARPPSPRRQPAATGIHRPPRANTSRTSAALNTATAISEEVFTDSIILEVTISEVEVAKNTGTTTSTKKKQSPW